jgi:hypothetical protein
MATIVTVIAVVVEVEVDGYASKEASGNRGRSVIDVVVSVLGVAATAMGGSLMLPMLMLHYMMLLDIDDDDDVEAGIYDDDLWQPMCMGDICAKRAVASTITMEATDVDAEDADEFR